MNERFPAASLRCRQIIKCKNLPSSFGRLRQKNCTKKRAARLFFLIQTIESLICGVVVAFAVRVIS